MKRSGAAMALVLALVALLDAALLYRQSPHLSYTAAELVVLVMGMMSISLAALGFLVIRVALSRELLKHPSNSKAARLFAPSYMAIRLSLSRPASIAAGLVAWILYAAIYMWAVGIITEAGLGPALSLITEGPPGYAPMIILFPVRGIGAVIPAYHLAIIALLSTIVSFTTAVLTYSFMSGVFSGKSLGPGLLGAASGLLISCPTCLTPPLTSLITAYIAPWALSFLIGFVREAAGTVLVYASSLVLLWIGISLSSRALEGRLICDVQDDKRGLSRAGL